MERGNGIDLAGGARPTVLPDGTTIRCRDRTDHTYGAARSGGGTSNCPATESVDCATGVFDPRRSFASFACFAVQESGIITAKHANYAKTAPPIERNDLVGCGCSRSKWSCLS